MKRLWAPWRMTYIRAEKTGGCFLCDIIESSKDRKNLIVIRGKTCVVLLNRYPYNNGHLMIAPIRHLDSLSGMNDEEMLEMMQLSRQATQLLQQICRPHGFNIGLNLGDAAGAGLKDHLHTHIVPRWTGDTNFMPVFAEVKVIPQTLEELRDLLCAALEKKSEKRQKKGKKRQN